MIYSRFPTIYELKCLPQLESPSTNPSPVFGESALGLFTPVLDHVLLDVEVGIFVVLKELWDLVGLALSTLWHHGGSQA